MIPTTQRGRSGGARRHAAALGISAGTCLQAKVPRAFDMEKWLRLSTRLKPTSANLAVPSRAIRMLALRQGRGSTVEGLHLTTPLVLTCLDVFEGLAVTVTPPSTPAACGPPLPCPIWQAGKWNHAVVQPPRCDP
jgi:hypothetical protein